MAKAADFHADFSTLPAFFSGTSVGTITINNLGQAVLACIPGYTVMQTATNAVDLTSSSVAAQIVTVQNSASPFRECGVSLIGTGEIDMFVSGGGNLTGRDFNGASVDLGVYSASTHAWWRIRESGGTVYFETSTSTDAGRIWTQRGTVATPSGMNATQLQIFVGGDATGSPNMVVDNMNILPAHLAAAAPFFGW
jgi:hypothetical protein